MTSAQTRSDAGLASSLRISVGRLARRLRFERAAPGQAEPLLSDTQFAALANLEKHGAMSPGELAEHEKVQPPSMTRVIAALEEYHLVTRAAHQSDRRQVVLTVTSAGRDLVIKSRRRRDAWLAKRLERRNATKIGGLKRAALSFDPQPLHNEVQYVRPMKVEEIVYLRVLQALDLQLRVGVGIGRNEGRRGDAEHVLRELLLVHQLPPGHTHQLDADTHEANIVDIRCNIRARPGKADPRPVRARLRIDAVTQLRGETVVNDKLPAYDAMRLRISPSLKPARLPEQSHLLFEARDDRVEVRLFIRQRLLLGDLQAFIRALPVDRGRDQARDRIAKHGIECRAEKGVGGSHT